MPTGKGKGCSLLANEKQHIATMTINRKMRIQNKMNQLRIIADMLHMHGRDKKEEHEGEKNVEWRSKAVPESSEQMKQSTSFLESRMPEASCYRNIRGLYSAMNGHMT
jgi:hypothetical protein